ncbi:hypothetical protein T484DRAFT_1787025 [Baffinella frigidus]|nr:hypothetical protein T484DRAFT_1787025 [Cryptophyta sp. CCMP2293]
MPANLAGILPSSYGRAPPAAKRSGGGEEKAEAIAKQGVTLCWCGNPADVLEVKLHPKGTVLQWIPAETPDLKVGLDPGPNKCTISNADSGFTRVISSIVVEARWREYNAGALWDEVVSEPAGRSQFSFPNGRSACSFLVCEAAKILHRRFSSATDPAAGVAPTGGALVTPALVADILTMGMALYDGGGRESLEAAGLEHCNVADVLELCGWMLKGAVSVAADGKFWGTLGDSNALLDSITMAVSASEVLSHLVLCLIACLKID